MKRIAEILLILFLLAGCGRNPVDSSPSKASDKNDVSTNLFTDDELKAALQGKSFVCKYNVYRYGEVREENDERFYIDDVSELSYTVSPLPGNSSKEDVQVSGTFKVTGSIYMDEPSTKTTSESVSFSVEVTKFIGRTTITCSNLEVSSIPLVVPLNPVDLDNLIEYCRGYKLEYTYKNPDYVEGETSKIYEYKRDVVDLSEPDMRVVLSCDPLPDKNYLFINEKLDIFKGDTYITSIGIHISQLFDGNCSFYGEAYSDDR